MRPMIRHILTCAIVLAIVLLVRSNPGAVSNDRPNPSSAVHALFDLDAPTAGPFPSDWFTVGDPSHNTGLRVNMPSPDCSVHVSDCDDLDVINTLDGFNLQPRLSIPFDGTIYPASATSKTILLISLGSTLGGDRGGRIVGINQVVWDPDTNTLHVESDDLLDQHTRYALIVTRGLRDASGAPIEPTEAFRRFRQTVGGDYKHALLEAVDAARHAGIPERDLVAASVFTTQSVTAVLEKIRDQIKAATPEPADFLLGPDGRRTVFSLGSVNSITFSQQMRVSTPPVFVDADVNLALLGIIPGAVGHVAFGKYDSPDYQVHHPGDLRLPGEFIPPVATRTGVPIVQGINEIYFNLFLPSGTKPPGGWPVALHGTGANGSKQRDLYLVATLAQHGIATIIINSVGRGFGSLSTLTVRQMSGESTTFPGGGRGIDQNGDGAIGDQEGQIATGRMAIIANRDAQRQTVVDYMQLVRVIQAGMDVDGDSIPDLDPSRISYFGWSFGANYGTTFLALDPSVRAGALYSPGGPVFENNRLSPSSRSGGLAAVLATRTPSLLNPGGITMLGGVAIAGAPRPFNENMPLRGGETLTAVIEGKPPYTIEIKSPVINSVPGAIAIQEYLEKRDWVNQSGNQVAYARHLRTDPLAGVAAKPVLILFGKGDQMIPNPNATAMLRAGALTDRAIFYRNDTAYGLDHAVPKDPHRFVNNIDDGNPLVAAIARFAQERIAVFLAGGNEPIVHSDPTFFQVRKLFEELNETSLPENFDFIP